MHSAYHGSGRRNPDGFTAQVAIPTLYAVMGMLTGLGLGALISPLAALIGMVVCALIEVAVSSAR